jgi:hypothetical protein
MSYKSYNEKTGMIEDINEVRKMGIKLARFVLMLANDTPLRLFMPEGLRLDTVVYAVSAMSLLQPTSQAQFMRELARALGTSDEAIEELIRDAGLSELLPEGHPDAPKIDAPLLDPNDPEVRQSAILSHIAEEQQKQPAQEEARTELPAGLEEFLRSLMEGKEKES